MGKIITGKICENAGFHLPVFFRIETELKILSLNGKVRASESSCLHTLRSVT